MSIPLTGTVYLTSTDDLVGMADERLVIEAADDSKVPQTLAKSYDDLSTGDATVKAQVIVVLSEVVKEAENEVEGYARGVYALPLNPVDGFVKNLIRDYAWFYLRRRRSMFRNADDRYAEERGLTARGMRIRNQDMILTSVLLDQGEGAEEQVFDYGSADRVAFRDPIGPMDLNPIGRRRWN